MEKKPQFTGPRRPAGGAPRPPRPAAPAPQQAAKGARKGNDRNSKDPYVINEHIRAKEVRLVGDNVEQGIYPMDKALRIAEKMELDLIEISPNAEPPVCRILDYQKFLYQQKKRQKEQKQKAAKVVVKEIRFGPQTDDHDYNFMLKHAIGFLKEGSKVKAYVFFRGRSILFKEQGEVLLLRFANDLEEYGKVEMMPVLEGKRMIIMISPLKAAPKKDKPEKERPAKGGEGKAAQEPVNKSEEAKASDDKE
ncbi:MAG: translation initiation factor IF-3 [Muribaculaceae bacterium]|nr:translation initiation factor IF-3 [Muribaculaceae bacterium]